jgi:hypothetical protein
VADTLSALVRDKWSPLLVQDFKITDEDTHRVVIESPNVRVVAVHDPRGEVDVAVFPRGGEWPGGWSYSGMVGTASVGRLLEIALAEMQAEPAVLNGEPDFYERLARENEDKSVAWTEHYSGRGPRPGNRHLP